MEDILDDINFIEILDSNVLGLNDVTITEERIREGYEIFFNDKQIKSHLTNLLFKSNSDISRLLMKVNAYFDMISGGSQMKQSSWLDIPSLHPVIKCNAHQYYTEKDEYEANPDFDDAHEIKMTPFVKFIENFHSLNRQTNGAYLETAQKLYALSVPFNSQLPNQQKIGVEESGIDAVDTQDRKQRVLGPQRNVYQGDDVFIAGFINKVNTSKKIINIPLHKYHETLITLQEGSKVDVFFNDFVYTKTGKAIESCKGTIKGDGIELQEVVKINGGLFTSTLTQSETHYVFPVDSRVKFNKRKLFNEHVMITWPGKTANDIYQFIKPKNVHEVLFICFDAIQTVDDFETQLRRFGHSWNDVTEVDRGMIDMKANVKLPPKVQRVTVKSLDDTDTPIKYLATFDGKNNLFRMRHAHFLRDKGLSQILDTFKQIITKRRQGVSRDAIEAEIANLTHMIESSIATTNKTCETSERPVRIAKQYSSIKDLMNDNGHAVYYDNKFDFTEYKLKGNSKSKEELEKALKAITKYSNMNASEFDREARYIWKGARKVQEGEHCVLMNDFIKKQIIFIRRKIEGDERWIKLFTVDKCFDTLAHYETLETTCTFDAYDKVCKTLQQYQDAYQVRVMKEKRENLKMLLALVESSLDDVDSQIAIFKIVQMHDVLRNMPFDANYSHKYDKDDIDDYEGFLQEMNFTDLSNNVEGQDFANAPLPLSTDAPPKKDAPSMDVVSILCRFLDISFKPTQFEYLHKNMLNTSSQKAVIDKELLEERDKLLNTKGVNKAMYNTNKEYKAKLDNMIEKRLMQMFDNRYKQLYYDEIVYGCGLITCMLMGSFPYVDVGKIVPKCSKVFSRIGYPLNEDKNKSLEAYLVCSLKSIAISDDIKYEYILEKETSVIEKDVRDAIDRILEDDYLLKTMIEANHNTLLARDSVSTSTVSDTLRSSFKPCFEFKSHSNDPLIKFLAAINKYVKNKPFMKLNFKKSAFASNSCCPELLSRAIDFYNIFSESSDVTSLLSKVRSENNDINHFAYIPEIKSVKPATRADIQHIVHKAAQTLKEGDGEHHGELHGEPLTDDYFNDELLPNIKADFEDINAKMGNALDDYDESIMVFLNDVLVLGLHDNRKGMRSAFLAFTQNTLPLILARIKNKYVAPKKTGSKVDTPDQSDNISVIINNVIKNDAFLDEFRLLDLSIDKTVFIDTSSDGEKNAIKNIAISMSHFMKVLKLIIEMPVKKGLDARCLILSYSIVSYIFKSLYIYLNNNVIEVDAVMKKVELLREEKKQTMMNAYLVDDQERQLQIQLRNIGLETWSTVFDRLKNVDINAYTNQQEENANYNMTDYRGENDDGDMDEDTDFARGSV